MKTLYILLVWYYICSICHISAAPKKKNDSAVYTRGHPDEDIAVYRLIGNDMPPLQSIGQLRWNTLYALHNENKLIGARKKWILNRIWNDTEFGLIYESLVDLGIKRKDIIVRCFDIDMYSRQKTSEDKLFYLTSQNEGRNAGIMDGRENNFEWSVILDGNTFITTDSWIAIRNALHQASAEGKKYMKIPYHRVQTEQDVSWLNITTDMKTVLNFAYLKGESQIAFRYDADEVFTLNDTNPNPKHGGPKKGYGQRNKSYLFKEGQVCGTNSTTCACADVAEGNEQEISAAVTPEDMANYTAKCGLVLRLWSYPTENVMASGLSPEEEVGFYCFFINNYDTFLQYREKCDKSKLKKGQKCSSHSNLDPPFCTRLSIAANQWRALPEWERKSYKNETDQSNQNCKERLSLFFIKESCIRSLDREKAQKTVSESLQLLQSKYLFDALAQGYTRSETNCDWVNFYNTNKKTNPDIRKPIMRRTM